MQHFLEARSITVDSVPSLRALNDISCRFTSGELSVVTGQNGSGKTALLKSLRGLLRLENGVVLLDAQPVSYRDPDLAKRIAFVPQNPVQSFLNSRVFDDVMLSVVGPSDTEREVIATTSLNRLGLGEYRDQNPLLLPFGKQRLLSYALASFGEPDFLILDDPFSGLDLLSTQVLLREIVAAKERGVSVIVATLDLERILAHANHLILLKEGRSIVDALPERVLPFLEAHGVRKPSAKLQDMTWLNP